MVDPITAIAAATTAFNTVKKLVEAGREIEDVAGQLGQWFTAASDIAKAEEYAKNPPLFKKLTNAKSVEQEALDAIIAKNKLKEQETTLREMIMYRYGINTYREMMQMRRDLRAQREKAVYRQKEKRKKMIEGIIIIAALSISSAILWFFVDFILSFKQ